MAQDTVLATDTLNAGRLKINEDIGEALANAAAALSSANTANSAANAAQANIDSHEGLTNNPHSVTKSQVGLSSVDNTADASKPISTFQQAALDLKANLTDIEIVNKVLVTGAVTLDSTAFGKIHDCSGTSADYTIILPTAVGSAGKMILIKCDPDPAILSKVITIDGSGTEKIDNYLTYKLAAAGRLSIVARVISGVGSWEIVSFDQGAYIAETLTYTGYSVAPTVNSRYKLLASGLLHLTLQVTAHGTSNTTALTYTLPGGFIPAFIQRAVVAAVTNNGAGLSTPGICSANSTVTGVIDCYSSPAFGAWTAALGKSVAGDFLFVIQ